MKKLVALCIGACLLAASGLALAHPGPHYGELLDLLAHIASSYDHLLLPLLVTALGLGGAALVKPSDESRLRNHQHDPR